MTDLELRRHEIVINHSPTPEEFREYWKRNYGPTIAAYKFNADDAERVAALDGLLGSSRSGIATEPGKTAYQAEYLLVTGTKRER